MGLRGTVGNVSAGRTFPQPEYPPDEPAERSTAKIFLRVSRAVVWVVYAIVIVIVIMLSLAFLLRLFGANRRGVHRVGLRSVDRTMAPFRGIFPEKPMGCVLFDTSLLFTAIVYLVVALLVGALLRWLGRKVSAEQRSPSGRGPPAGGAEQAPAAGHAGAAGAPAGGRRRALEPPGPPGTR